MRYLTIAVLLAVFAVPGLGRAGDKEVLRIGIPRSMFQEIPPGLALFAGLPFKELIKSQTGLNGDVLNEADSFVVSRDLDSGKLKLGVFLGHEFAWAKQQYPGLEPLVCAVPRTKEVQALLLVRHDCKASNLAEMRGAKLVIATAMRDHPRMFLEGRRAMEIKVGGFGSTEKVDTQHDAIHKVMENEADITAVDSAAWAYFEKLYPGPCQNLRVLARSDVFPPNVIAYKKGSLDDATIKAIRDGLSTTHENPKAKRMMSVIRLDRFDSPPKNYDEMLKACLKAYPKPLTDK